MQTPKELVLSVYDAYAAGDVESLAAVMGEGICHTCHEGNQSGVFCGRFIGREAVLERIQAIATAFAIESFACVWIAADGGKVAAICRFAGTGRATGARIDTRLAHFFTVENGLVVEFEEIFDSGLVAAAIGSTVSPLASTP